jgi:hypothetical protein
VSEAVGRGGYGVPILLIVFNRPDTTSRVFEAIRKIRPKALYVAADGPRPGRDGERSVCDRVRAIATNVDWECNVHTRFLEENKGCKLAVSGAIDWFFSCVEEGVILEDDCLPVASFFPFCEELLARYRADPRVMHIGGYKPRYVDRDAYAYNFGRYTHIWGWATWRRAWQKYDVDMKILDQADMQFDDYEIFCEKSVTRHLLLVLQLVRRGVINTWDYQWNLAVRVNSGLCVRPAINLVENIGKNHADGTHVGRTEIADVTGDIEVPVERHPPYVLINRRLDRQFEFWTSRIGLALLKLLRK